LILLAIATGLAMKGEWRGVSVLDLFWKGILPLVPLLLLLAPHAWRSICPVATLNLFGDQLARLRHGTRRAHLRRETNRGIKLYGAVFAAGLLWLLVPMRLLLLNESAAGTLALVLAIAAMAIAMGSALPWKGGWCSSVCPVYPVEKFYGAAPVWTRRDPRCVPGNLPDNCYRCALHCLDVPLEEVKYWQAMNGVPAGRLAAAVRSFFQGSFPGFVLAYVLLANFGDLFQLAPAQRVFFEYGVFLALIAASFLLYRLAQWAAGERRDPAFRSLWSRRIELVHVLTAVNVYYLIGGPGVAEVVSTLGGWNEQQFAIGVALVAAVLLASLLWLRRAWNSPAPAWARW
jgi:hypothetical protein